MTKTKLKTLALNLLVSVGTGIIAGLLSMGAKEYYASLNMPKFAPPAIVFPIIWNILYVLMGISSYWVIEGDSNLKKNAIIIYTLTLILNILWPVLFFRAHLLLPTVYCILILWMAVIIMTFIFYKADKRAGLLQIPYILWLTFAAILNISIFFMN